jgi:hypothetical protein
MRASLWSPTSSSIETSQPHSIRVRFMDGFSRADAWPLQSV